MSDACPHCGGPPASVTPTPDGTVWAVCARCGMSFQSLRAGAPMPVSAPAAIPGAKKKRGIFGCLFGVPMFGGVFIPLFALFCPRACATVDESHQVALTELRACPRAEQALGQDIDAAWVGTSSGEASSGPSSGSAHWSFSVEGSLARGDYTFDAYKDGQGWHVTSGTLVVGNQIVRVPMDCGTAAVTGAPPTFGGMVVEGLPPTPAATPTVLTGGPCDAIQRCCDATRGEATMSGICQSVASFRGTVAEAAACPQLMSSARQVLASRGPLPDACR